ncbi:hypothetical protein [Crocosphaera sp. XPORK-15E]|uniref:hypothetical protein n=1 Tax=Crocosphaera sp. XPORK-15E TaxID=3110247 RepID=UPI002B1EF245|nr:hypothetical protein [Crocosphaera sp. XPORK-15E]MEA5533710.1 hypothetical protein [Crocosphaera sp. XPORK-15E]
MLMDQIIEELKAIPQDKLTEIYDLIHYFRIGLGKDAEKPRTPGLLKGKLSDSFFDALPEDELKQWE